jgi:hypothetical protein
VKRIEFMTAADYPEHERKLSDKLSTMAFAVQDAGMKSAYEQPGVAGEHHNWATRQR